MKEGIKITSNSSQGMSGTVTTFVKKIMNEEELKTIVFDLGMSYKDTVEMYTN